MKKIIALLLAAAAFASCGILAPTPPLYYWGGETNGTTAYEELAYRDFKTQTPEDICRLVFLYENMVSHPSGTRQVPPPGICAEYGYLLLQPTTATYFTEKATAQQKKIFEGSDYGSLFTERGKELLQMELELYPESRQFIEPLIKKLAP